MLIIIQNSSWLPWLDNLEAVIGLLLCFCDMLVEDRAAIKVHSLEFFI